MPRTAALLILLLFAGLPARSGTPEQVHDIARAIELPAIISIMREEGISYGNELADVDVFEPRLCQPVVELASVASAVSRAVRRERELAPAEGVGRIQVEDAQACNE